MAEHGIDAIDLLVVNLVSASNRRTVAKPDCSDEDAIENIDIGGPAMLRAAAKNSTPGSAVLTDPADYAEVLAADRRRRRHQDATRERLALKTYALTSRYDAAVSAYLSSLQDDGSRAPFAGVLGLQFDKQQDMRYGENPHQRAAFYIERSAETGTIAAARQLQGKELSYNNIADADAALECVKTFVEPALRHRQARQPLRRRRARDGIREAYDQAFRTDPTSAFGGIIAFNRELDADTAKRIVERQFVEVIIAPSVSAEARAASPPSRTCA